MGARKALEIGTFTGYSALAVALALPPEGRLITCDISEEWTAVARRHWEEAGVADKLDLRLAPALETLDALIDGGAAVRAQPWPFVDLLRADSVMARLDGGGLAWKVAKAYPDLRVVLMTGHAAERDRAHNLDALVHQVVSKPFSLAEICETVDAALNAPPDLH